MKKYNICVVGATGMVGRKFLEVLEERKLPAASYKLLASAKSAGTKVKFMGEEYTIMELNESAFEGVDIALFSAGGDVSKKYAPIAVKAGAVVIDNSSAWRMDKEVPLVVPEVNKEEIKNHKGIIANPNCSTIQAMVALKPLHDLYGIKRIVYSTYQAVSGAGMGGFDDLKNGVANQPPKKFPYPIFANCIPQIDVFLENGYTKEEMKMVEETKKILNDYNMKVTATTVRIPVYYGHSESVNVEFAKPCNLDEIRSAFAKAPGVVLVDDTANAKYPMPLDCEGKDEVFVGRVRLDDTVESGINMWVVADNIRKGAATNAVQIAEELIKYNG